MPDNSKLAKALWKTPDTNAWSQRNADAFNSIMDINQFLPITGDIQSGVQAANDLKNKKYASALLNSAGLLPFVPALGGIVKKAPYEGEKIVGSYQAAHKPMTVENGAAQLHDIEKVFGPEIYSKEALQYFGSGGFDREEKAILNLMRQLRNKPEEMVTIYRGVPKGVNSINKGDWITLHPDIAKEYGNVIKMKVPAKHITSWPDSLVEFGYYPD